MKIIHAVIRKLRPRACQPDGVRGLVSGWREAFAPPILAVHVPYPFRLALRGESIFVPIAEHRIRKGNDDTPITFGWSYVHWRHFLAHVLLAGFPEISTEAISLSLRCKLLSQIGNRCFLRGCSHCRSGGSV